MTFEKGDKVRAIDNAYPYTCAKYHYEGVVVDVPRDGIIRVKATKHDGVVSGDIHTVRAASFEKVVTPKIVITTDGKTTLARLYEDGKVTRNAEAVCHPTDTFDFSIGAKLAMQRLVGDAAPEEPKQLYNGKVVCVNLGYANKNLYTVGKIYQFHDGLITTDNMATCPSAGVRDFDEWQKFSSSTWLEIVE